MKGCFSPVKKLPLRARARMGGLLLPTTFGFTGHGVLNSDTAGCFRCFRSHPRPNRSPNMSTQPLPLSHTQDPVLRAALRGLDELLPPIRYTSREGGEVDYYGAGDLIAAELQMDRPLFTGFKAS